MSKQNRGEVWLVDLGHDGYAVKGTCHFLSLLIWNYKSARLGNLADQV